MHPSVMFCPYSGEDGAANNSRDPFPHRGNASPRRHWFMFFKHKTRESYIYKNNNNNGSSRGGHGASCEGYLFDPNVMAWYAFPFLWFLLGFSPASSSSGLLCWVSDETGPKTMLLCNPILGSLTQLPPTLRPKLFPSVGLTISPTCIDVTVSGDDMISPYAMKNLTSKSFHNDGGGFYSTWGTTSSLPRPCSLESGRMVHAQGKFYCMNCSPFMIVIDFFLHVRGNGIGSYNMWTYPYMHTCCLRKCPNIEFNSTIHCS